MYYEDGDNVHMATKTLEHAWFLSGYDDSLNFLDIRNLKMLMSGTKPLRNLPPTVIFSTVWNNSLGSTFQSRQGK